MNNHTRVLLLGGILVDRYFEISHYPAAGQDTLIHDAYDRVGGCAINVAVTLQNLGCIPYIVNQVGKDPLGNLITRYVSSLSLPNDCMKESIGGKSGYCLTMLDPVGERTFFTYKGCETIFSPDMLPEALLSQIDFVYITGYYLLNQQTAAAVLDLAARLKENNCPILFDPGPLVGAMDAALLRQLIGLSDWMIPNAFELELIQKKLGLSGDAVKSLQGLGCTHLALKKGSQGVEMITPEERFSVNSYTIQAVDTSGAGDSFAGGFIYGLASGQSVRQAAVLANACGAYTATLEGPHGCFTLSELNTFKDQHKDEIS